MSYKYVTVNNLYEKQNYMYSEYTGIDFLRKYIASRKDYLNVAKQGFENDEAIFERCKTEEELKDILSGLKAGGRDYKAIAKLNMFVKSFEVRKRIYTEYDERWKPIEGAGFEAYGLYLLFADCLVYAYKETRSLKYLSCLMKVNDTMLSLTDKYVAELKPYLSWVIQAELKEFSKLAIQIGINLGDGI